MRVVEDYDVDRRQVYAQQCVEPSRTNNPKVFLGSQTPERKAHIGRSPARFDVLAKDDRDSARVDQSRSAIVSRDFLRVYCSQSGTCQLMPFPVIRFGYLACAGEVYFNRIVHFQVL